MLLELINTDKSTFNAISAGIKTTDTDLTTTAVCCILVSFNLIRKIKI